MISLAERKVGIVACSGEELAEGTVARLVALKVLQELRRERTVTICLPLFLAGGQQDRTFAKFYPTITIDGCALRCAAKGTATYSAEPAASIVVSELAAEQGISGITGRRCLNAAGRQAVDLVAERVAEHVDRLLGVAPPAGGPPAPQADAADAGFVGCSCGSGIPVKVLPIAGQSIEVVALPLLLAKVRETHPAPCPAALDDLLQLVRVYNYVAPEDEAAWRGELAREFEAHCKREGTK